MPATDALPASEPERTPAPLDSGAVEGTEARLPAEQRRAYRAQLVRLGLAEVITRLETEQTMHLAWRKRAEEAEARLSVSAAWEREAAWIRGWMDAKERWPHDPDGADFDMAKRYFLARTTEKGGTT
jgi:hypothetical protein